MIENNNHTNNHFKLVLFKSKWQMFLLSGLVMQVLLAGCATRDEETPVITSVKVEGNVVTIEATDNVDISAYLVEQVPYDRIPTITSDSWQATNVQTISEDGLYYIWVKDSSDNLGHYSEAVRISFNLAQKFDHLNWLTPAEGTRVVDGVTYNLAELKAEYGDLYRLVEPLTKEEIESRFAYLAQFMELQKQKSDECYCQNWTIYGGMSYDSENIIEDKYTDTIYQVFEDIATSTKQKIKLFSKNYLYISQLKLYDIFYPASFNSEQGLLGLGTDIVNKVSFDDKNFFVRDYTMKYDIGLKVRAELSLEPEYTIEDWE